MRTLELPWKVYYSNQAVGHDFLHPIRIQGEPGKPEKQDDESKKVTLSSMNRDCPNLIF